MTFRTIDREATVRITVQKSIFIAAAREVADENGTRAFLADVKRIEPHASHYPYAYRLGADKAEISHCSDGGEPGGSAGRPILGALQSNGTANAMVIVARYFGGKKLGIPGLIEAYRAAAAEVLTAAGVSVRVPVCLIALSLKYDQLDPVRHMAKRHGAEEMEIVYDAAARMRLKVPLTARNAFFADLANLGVAVQEMN